jgi:hypothetical protein
MNKKSKDLLTGMAALLLAFGLILTGCPTDADEDPTPGPNDNGKGGNTELPSVPTANEVTGHPEKVEEYFTDLFVVLKDDQQKRDAFKVVFGTLTKDLDATLEKMGTLDAGDQDALMALFGPLMGEDDKEPELLSSLMICHPHCGNSLRLAGRT